MQNRLFKKHLYESEKHILLNKVKDKQQKLKKLKFENVKIKKKLKEVFLNSHLNLTSAIVYIFAFLLCNELIKK